MIPNPHVIRMPHKIFPFIFLTIKIAVMIIPINAKSTVIPSVENVPAFTESLKENIVTNVEESTTTCAFCNPINAIKRPIPTETACLRFIGIALKIASRTFVRESTMKISPSTQTAASASCHVNPIPITTVYVKYAFSPIPGASTNG